MIWKDPTKNTDYPDRLYISIAYKDSYKKVSRFSCKVRVLKKDWCPDTKSVLDSDPDFDFKNTRISSKHEEILKARKTFWIENDRQPTVIEMREQINKLRDKGKSVLELCEEYLQYSEKKDFSVSTMRKKYTIYKILSTIQEKRGEKLYLKDITTGFCEEMAHGLTSGEYAPKRRALKATSVQIYISELATFMNWARVVRKATSSRDHEDFLSLSNEYLTVRSQRKVSIPEETWMKIYRIDVNILPGHKSTRASKRMMIDAAILGYLMGRRINEIVTMEMADITLSATNRKYFTNIAKKVNDEFIVPISDLAWQIIERQGHETGRVFRPINMTDRSFMTGCSRILKECIIALDLDEEIKVVYGLGNSLVEERLMLSSVISVHYGRGDFTTRVLSKNTGNVGIRKIQQLLGHSSIRTTERYLRKNHARTMEGLEDLIL